MNCPVHGLEPEYLVDVVFQFQCPKCLIKTLQSYPHTKYYPISKLVKQLELILQNEKERIKTVDIKKVIEETVSFYQSKYQRFIKLIRDSMESSVQYYNKLIAQTGDSFKKCIQRYSQKGQSSSQTLNDQVALFQRICSLNERSILKQNRLNLQRIFNTISSNRFFRQQIFKKYDITRQQLQLENSRLNAVYDETSQLFKKIKQLFAQFHIEFQNKLQNNKFYNQFLQETELFNNGLNVFRNIKNYWVNVSARRQLPFDKEIRIQIVEIGDVSWGLAVGLTLQCVVQNKSIGGGPSIPSFVGLLFVNSKKLSSEKTMTIVQHFKVGDIIGIKQDKRVAYFSKNGKRLNKAIPLQNNRHYYINYALRLGQIKLL